ncbi:MAG: hypothetical protein GXC72_06290 [Chitinophagaceae bacterium]|nr:hypothetical protein [Chitinophagaceae bacterium]
MVFLFRDKSIINVFLLLLLSIAVHAHFIVTAPVVDTGSASGDGLISLVLKHYVAGISPALLFLLYHALVLVQAIRLNVALNELRMYPVNTYIPAMTYVMFTGVLTAWCDISAALVSNSLIIWIFLKLSRLYNHPNPKTLLFNTGLISGLTIICYHPTAILIGVVLFALAVVRPFRLAEWLVLLMGALLPYYFVFAYLYLNNRLPEYQSLMPDLFLGLPVQQADTVLWISVGLLGLLLLLGLYFWQIHVGRMVIQIRKNWGVMMVMLLTLLPVPFLFQQGGIGSGLISLVPLSVFSANAFTNPRRMVIPNLLFWMLVILLIVNNLHFLKN